MHRQIAGKLTGPVTKWIVLVVALVAAAGMSTLNAKLIDVQENEASSWLPADAESTKVLEELSETVDPNDIPTLVVYHRAGGLTEDDLGLMDRARRRDRRDRGGHRSWRALAERRGEGGCAAAPQVRGR